MTHLDTQYQSAADSPAVASVPTSAGVTHAHVTTSPAEIALDKIAPNPYQPRKDFSAEELANLTASIKQQGILQPLVISAAEPGAEKPYILIAGERRLRAAVQAGLTSVPCVIRQASRRQILEWAIIENIQRSDLNPIEKAKAYQDYIDRFHLTQADAAERMGQPRTTVANYLRLLELHDDIQKMLVDGALSFGHAKILAGLTGQAQRQLELAGKIVADGLTVRDLERLLAPPSASPAAEPKPAVLKPAYIRDLEERLTHAVGTRVSIQQARAKNKGKIVVEYYSLDDFDRITSSLGLGSAD